MEILYVENRDNRVSFRGKINNLGDIKMFFPEENKENQGGKSYKSPRRAEH